MVNIKPFEVEQWMDKYETTPGVLNIAETCCSSVTLEELVELDASNTRKPPIDYTTRLGYGAILGSEELRKNIASTYESSGVEPLPPDSIIVAQGAISANYLVLYSLIGPGDHVICVYPTYQQLYSVPESLGADVSLWKLQAENGFAHDVTGLKALMRNNTKMIIINNPNNPTGTAIPAEVLRMIVGVAEERGILLLSDEVYRPLFHSLGTAPMPPSVLALGYEKSIVTGSMSKAWALAGVRVGWIATRDASIITQIATARDYTTISVSGLDDQVSRYALGPGVRTHLLSRNLALARTNLALLSEFVDRHPNVITWVKPTAATVAFVQFKQKDMPIDDVQFCKDLIAATNVMIIPGSKCFGNSEDFKGYVRIGYVGETETLRQALALMSTYVEEHLS